MHSFSKYKISAADRYTSFLLPILLIIVDYIAVVSAEQVAFVIRNFLIPDGGVLHISWFNFWVVFPLLYLIFINVEQLYSRRMQFWKLIEKLFQASIYGTVAVIIVLYIGQITNATSRLFIVLFWVLTFFSLTVFRYLIKKILEYFNFLQIPVLIIGAGKTAELLVNGIIGDAGMGYIYEKLIKGYTEKQWGRPCTELPAFIIKRLPVRYIYDNNYFNDRYQGVPVGGYNVLIDNLLEGIEVKMNCDFNADQEEWKAFADKIIYTGAIDEYFDYKFGELEYRGLRFEIEKHDVENYQGVAAVNYTDRETSYTRIIEHKHFEFGKQPVSYITKEYPADWHRGEEAYYPVNNPKNNDLYEKYVELAKDETNVIFGGRLGEYKYYDMDKVIASALDLVAKEL